MERLLDWMAPEPDGGLLQPLLEAATHGDETPQSQLATFVRERMKQHLPLLLLLTAIIIMTVLCVITAMRLAVLRLRKRVKKQRRHLQQWHMLTRMHHARQAFNICSAFLIAGALIVSIHVMHTVRSYNQEASGGKIKNVTRLGHEFTYMAASIMAEADALLDVLGKELNTAVGQMIPQFAQEAHSIVKSNVGNLKSIIMKEIGLEMFLHKLSILNRRLIISFKELSKTFELERSVRDYLSNAAVNVTATVDEMMKSIELACGLAEDGCADLNLNSLRLSIMNDSLEILNKQGLDFNSRVNISSMADLMGLTRKSIIKLIRASYYTQSAIEEEANQFDLILPHMVNKASDAVHNYTASLGDGVEKLRNKLNTATTNKDVRNMIGMADSAFAVAATTVIAIVIGAWLLLCININYSSHRFSGMQYDLMKSITFAVADKDCSDNKCDKGVNKNILLGQQANNNNINDDNNDIADTSINANDTNNYAMANTDANANTGVASSEVNDIAAAAADAADAAAAARMVSDEDYKSITLVPDAAAAAAAARMASDEDYKSITLVPDADNAAAAAAAAPATAGIDAIANAASSVANTAAEVASNDDKSAARIASSVDNSASHVASRDDSITANVDNSGVFVAPNVDHSASLNGIANGVDNTASNIDTAAVQNAAIDPNNTTVSTDSGADNAELDNRSITSANDTVNGLAGIVSTTGAATVVADKIKDLDSSNLVHADAGTTQINSINTDAARPNLVSADVGPNLVSADVGPNLVSADVRPNLVSADVRPNLVSADVTRPNLVSPDATRPNLVSADVRPNLVNAGATIQNLVNADATRPNLVSADATRPNLAYTDATRPNLAYTDATRPNQVYAGATRPNQVYAGATRPNLVYTDATRSNLVSADATRSNLVSADATRSNLVSADATRSNLVSPDATRPNLVSADATRPNLVSADATRPTAANLKTATINTAADPNSITSTEATAIAAADENSRSYLDSNADSTTASSSASAAAMAAKKAKVLAEKKEKHKKKNHGQNLLATCCVLLLPLLLYSQFLFYSGTELRNDACRYIEDANSIAKIDELLENLLKFKFAPKLQTGIENNLNIKLPIQLKDRIPSDSIANLLSNCPNKSVTALQILQIPNEINIESILNSSLVETKLINVKRQVMTRVSMALGEIKSRLAIDRINKIFKLHLPKLANSLMRNDYAAGLLALRKPQPQLQQLSEQQIMQLQSIFGNISDDDLLVIRNYQLKLNHYFQQSHLLLGRKLQQQQQHLQILLHNSNLTGIAQQTVSALEFMKQKLNSRESVIKILNSGFDRVKSQFLPQIAKFADKMLTSFSSHFGKCHQIVAILQPIKSWCRSQIFYICSSAIAIFLACLLMLFVIAVVVVVIR